MEDSVDDALHSRALKMFEEADQSSVTANDMSRKCRNYTNGEQLTEEEFSALSKRGQPAIVINLIRKEVNWMRGYEIQSRVDPRAYPRNPDDDESAEAATDALRFVSDKTKYDKHRSRVWENLIVEGLGGVEIIHKFKPPMREAEIVLNRYSWDRLFADPHSSEPDYSDARYKGAVIWSDMEELKAQYEGKDDIIEASIGPNDSSSDVYDDKPYHTVWSDPKRRRVRVVLVYYRTGGQWKWVKFTKGGILEEGESPYTDDMGDSVCPLVMGSMYVSEDNTRHGVVKDFLDPQDEVNKRRSKLLHQMTSRQTWGPKGAVDSVASMKRELSKPNGHIEIKAEAIQDARETGVMPFNIIPDSDHAAGQYNLYQESKANIEVMGANSALQGNAGGQSGRAIMAEQQGGLVEIAPVYDRLLDFDNEVYSHMWMRIRQFWKEEKWVRVTDDENVFRFVGLNQPQTLQDAMADYTEEEILDFAQRVGLYQGDPRLRMVVGKKNDVAKMDVDIIIDDAPDAVTLQGETFEQLVNLASSTPGAVPTEILIEAAPNLDRKIKEKLLERMQQQQEQQGQVQGAEMEAQQQSMQAKAKKDDASAQRDYAEAQKTMTEAQFAGFGA